MTARLLACGLLSTVACGSGAADDDTGTTTEVETTEASSPYTDATTGSETTGSAVSSSSDASSSSGVESSGETTGGSGSSTGGEPPAPPAGVFGGGPLYHDADVVMPRMRASGFNTVVIWTIHVDESGDFILNDVPLISDGQYIADPDWPDAVASLGEDPTTVTRVEIGLGSYGVPDFETIEMLLEAQGSGPQSILYRNFEALRNTLPGVDAINYDDESNYDVDSTVELSLMLADLGFRITLTPYTASQFWIDVYDEVDAHSPGTVDRVMLQVYAGGAGNDPPTWSTYFDGLRVEAGLWSLHGDACAIGDTPTTVQDKLETWSPQIDGGWMWLLDDMLACDAAAPLEDYAAAIHAALPGRG